VVPIDAAEASEADGIKRQPIEDGLAAHAAQGGEIQDDHA
jgi:hypothetical protein